MAAKIQNAYECPHCHNTLLDSKRPITCPACSYDFGEEAVDFKYPVTLTEQQERLQRKLGFYDAVLEMPIIKANSIMNDALNIIETISAKNCSISDISQVIGMAMKIGKIATKYDKYLRAGGKHVPSLFFKQKDKKDELSETSAGGDAAGGIAKPM